MTTVAFDGETLAADSLQVGQCIDQIHSEKICQHGSLIAGFAGEVQQGIIALRWLKDQSKPKPSPQDLKEMSALIIRDGKAYHMSDMCELIPVGKPCAIGSGGEFAMGAMLAGATAIEAVKIAAKLDVNTGGKVRSIKIK